MKMYKSTTAVLIGLLSCAFSALANDPAKINYEDLERQTQQLLNRALKDESKTRPSDIMALSEALRSLSAARIQSLQADNAAAITKVVAKFAPQLEAAPDLIKRAIPVFMASGGTNKQVAERADAFFSATNAYDAKRAGLKLIACIPAYDAKMQSVIKAPWSTDPVIRANQEKEAERAFEQALAESDKVEFQTVVEKSTQETKEAADKAVEAATEAAEAVKRAIRER